MRILVVDDEPGAIIVLSAALPDMVGAIVDGAATPEIAIRRLQEQQYGLLITDYLIASDFTGIDLIRKLRNGEIAQDSRTCNLPVIIVSSHPDLGWKLRDIEGVVALGKPFSCTEIAELIIRVQREGTLPD